MNLEGNLYTLNRKFNDGNTLSQYTRFSFIPCVLVWDRNRLIFTMTLRFNIHQKQNLVKKSGMGLKICISNKFPCATVATNLGPHSEHL